MSFTPFRPEMRQFLVLAQSPSISKAAEILNLQQPALTKVIRKLEQELNSQLFFRSNQGLRLSPDGELLLKRIRELTHFHEANEQKELDEPSGRFRIGCHPTIASAYMPRFFTALKRSFPKVEWLFQFLPSREVTRKILAGELEFGIVAGPEEFESLLIKKITVEHISVFKGAKACPEILFYNPDMIGSPQHLKKLKFTDTQPIANYDVILSLLTTGCGYGLLPSSVLSRAAGLETVRQLGETQICLIGKSELRRVRSQYRVWQELLARLQARSKF